MYQVQIQNFDSEWVAHGEPTPYYSVAGGLADEWRSLGALARVVCVDSAAEPK